MSNLEILRLRYEPIDRCWDLIQGVEVDGRTAKIILARRDGGDIAINVLISSSSLEDLWSRFTQEPLPACARELALCTQAVGVDISSIIANPNSVRFYSYIKDMNDIPYCLSHWPSSEAQEAVYGNRVISLGIYSDSSQYKYYIVNMGPIRLDKYLYDGQGQLQDCVSEQQQDRVYPHELTSFGIDPEGLDLDRVTKMQRNDGTAEYFTIE